MTIGPAPQCLSCVHWVSPLVRDDPGAQVREPKQICSAYPLPESIPDAIWHSRADHRQPFAGDHGVRWEAKNGRSFPDALIQAAS